MSRGKSTLLNDLSTTDLKRLLAARERIDVLEEEKARLTGELARIDRELGKLMSGAAGTGKKGVRKKAAVGKTSSKKRTVKKKTVKKKVGKKAAGKKVRKVSRQTSAGKATGKKGVGKKTGAGKMKLEDVIILLIRKNGGPIAFQDLKSRILKGKLFRTKSGNFDNVLRRTLSTSGKVGRVGRGIYDVA